MWLHPSFHCQSSINPEISINSGQMFLWEQIGNSWYGIFGDHVMKFSTSWTHNSNCINNNKNSDIQFDSYPKVEGWERKVFRLDDDIKKILSTLSNDALVSKTIKKYPGLRLMRQEPHQCIFSFVCASNTSILMIRKMLKNLSKKFGSKVIFDGKEFFTFPSVNSLNKATINELRSCGVGYRAKAIKAVAMHIVSGNLDIDYLARIRYHDAKEELLKIYGIGNKIADCILLFSLEKLDAFPIDVWILRALSRYYRWLFNENENKFKMTERITINQYKIVSASLRNYFGKYSGYAQQYIFYYIRESAGKKW
ncbi:MAG: DNA glycosylase [Candidatus Nitrosopolaris sp.]|jgi:N-glycosylase/DNA lyase